MALGEVLRAGNKVLEARISVMAGAGCSVLTQYRLLNNSAIESFSSQSTAYIVFTFCK